MFSPMHSVIYRAELAFLLDNETGILPLIPHVITEFLLEGLCL